MDNKGLAWITNCRNRWLAYQLLAKLLYAAAVTVLVAAVLLSVGGATSWVYPIGCLCCFIAFTYLSGVIKVGLRDIAAMLDTQFPELEYSTSLVLKPPHALGALQQLQVARLYRLIFAIPSGQFANPRVLIRPAGAFVLAAACYVVTALYIVPIVGHAAAEQTGRHTATLQQTVPLPASIAEVRVVISPPAYTGLEKTTQQHLEVTAPQGSTVTIRLTATDAVSQVTALFDGKDEHTLTAVTADSLQWELEIKPQKSGFFQFTLDGELSALYPLSLTPDLPIAVRVKTPDQHTVIDFGFPEKVKLSASLQDDYAINNATIMTTISSGKGEGVSFKSHEIPLNKSVKGRKEIRLMQEINLKKLGMAAGDELYFYLKAHDNAGQESRSDVFVVVLQDTAELFSMSGMVAGVDLMPQYFRSQRQIIIDTEKLITEMDTIPVSKAQTRSNNLGIDQQLLRLRYGKFLGEEAEDAIGGHVGHEEHDHDHDHDDDDDHEHTEDDTTEVPIDVATLIAAMSHQHDRAEDATFFDAEQKASLKATLTEMWNTELRLRTYKPREALPYAYKALRLLKELQQKSRVYVGKAATKTTPLDPEKRLTGELDELEIAQQAYLIREPSQGQQAQQHLQAALAYLSNLKRTQQLDDRGRQLLIAAEKQLMAAAIMEPGKYLRALKAIRQLEEKEGKNSRGEVDVVGKAIQELLPTRTRQPEMRHSAGDNDLYNQYFRQITPK